MRIKVSDSLEFLKTIQDYENDIIFADPPYALGSELIIRDDGKVDYKKATDFMNKWEMPTGDYWEKWFKEAYRTLKHGGYILMYGMDRQLLLFKYYATLAGFDEHQSLYWYYISNFPKAADLSKAIDKSYGEEREQIAPSPNARPMSLKEDNLYKAGTVGKDFNITAASHPLAKKYEGYKYSVAPLKQTNETILVFKKPNKTGSVLHDTLAYEDGDDSVTVSALDIEGNRVPLVGDEVKTGGFGKVPSGYQMGEIGESREEYKTEWIQKTEGRYPSQTFINNETAQVIDEQSGDRPSWKGQNHNTSFNPYGGNSLFSSTTERVGTFKGFDDTGGASKILHKVEYGPEDFNITPEEFDCNSVYEEQEESDDLFGFDIEDNTPEVNVKATLEKILEKREYPFNLYIYNPKVSKGERNIGLEHRDVIVSDSKGHGLDRVCATCGAPQLTPELCKCEVKSWVTKPKVNNHPTLKPIELNYQILSLFKTPNNQRICYPFAGAGSEIIGGLKAGFHNWSACELNPDYVDIAQTRIAFFKKYFN